MQTTRIKGLTITAMGVLFIVPDALLVKITSVDPVVFLFWRGLLLAVHGWTEVSRHRKARLAVD